jgi:MinD superfamily P-loop ATPase
MEEKAEVIFWGKIHDSRTIKGDGPVKELIVLSGKGGTGKTTIAAFFAAKPPQKVLADADVDAADLFILLEPQVRMKREFKSGQLAVIDRDLCTGCDRCREFCRFGAIEDGYSVDPMECEGCGVCTLVCPEKAVTLKQRESGEWYVSETRFGPFVHARLRPGEENSGKLVALVRHHARTLAEERGIPWLIVDGPPGIGCPVISAMAGAGAALIVTEPTPSGLHDMRRVAELASQMRVPKAVCINKWDLNPEMAVEIENLCRDLGMEVVGKVSYDENVPRALMARKSVLEWAPQSKVVKELDSLWERVQEFVPEAVA